MSTQNDNLYKKWNSWIDHLDKEKPLLFSQRQMFEELQEIIQQNPKIQRPGDFHFWVAFWHMTSLSLSVRRQCDKDENVISYRQLLEGIKKNTNVISRSRFIAEFVSSDYLEEAADEDFNKYSGIGNEFVALSMIEQDIKELEDSSIKVKKYVDKRIAHHEKKEFNDIPSYIDLSNAIDYLGQLHCKYYGLFRCLGKLEIAPVKQYDWTTIFLHPWIDPNNHL